MAEDIEAKAKEMGWIPKDQFRGNQELWTDAETYVKRGEQVLPILRANNQRLMTEVGTLRAKTEEQAAVIATALTSIEELKTFNSEMARGRAKESREDVKAKLVAAKKSGDVEAEVELTEQLGDLNTAIKAAEKEPDKKPEPEVAKTPQADPAFVQWQQENPWYNTDMRKAGLANGIAQELRRNDPEMKLKGKAFFDKVSEEVETFLGGNPSRQAPSKVEGGARGNNGSDSGSKTYADLPADVKAVCDRQGKRLIGPKGSGKAFETEEAWRKHYVGLYDWST